MNEHEALERRVAALIRAYADRAPTDVDPVAMARLATTGSPLTTPVWFGLTTARRGLAFALVLTALLVTIVSGALISGALPIRRDPVDLLLDRAFVEPFVGLPPEGAAPSAPEKGELVLSFAGRVSSLGLDFHRMWLYTDGRLIWKSNLEGSSEGWRLRFGASEPTTAVIVQHLTPDGVDLVRSDVMASARVIGPVSVGKDTTEWSRPGVIWGGLTLGDGDRLLDADWSDSRLPARLADPGSWLPPSAWADRRIEGYVPSHYAMCAWPNGTSRSLKRLPDAVQALVLSKGTRVPGSGLPPGDCYGVTTDVARAIVAAFDSAGHPPALRRGPISYVFPDASVPDGEVTVDLLELTPHGEVVCNCG